MNVQEKKALKNEILPKELDIELTRVNPKKELHDAKRKTRKKGIEKENKKKSSDDIQPKEFAEVLINLNEQISKLTYETNQQEYDNILKRIPDDKPIFKKNLFKNIAKKTDFTLKEIRIQYNELHNSPKIETNTKKKESSIEQLETKLKSNPKNKNNKYLKFNSRNLIEITSSKINLLTLNKFGGYESEPMSDFSLKLLSKTIDYKRDHKEYYTFEANKNIFYNYTVESFLKVWSGKIYFTIGKNVIKFVFNNLNKNIPEKKAKYTLGFKNGWYLPFIIDTNYSIMWDTPEQREVLKRCEKIYTKYSDEEKVDIINIYKELIEITDMPKEYITIIVSWCIIAPFKLYFIKELGLFPILLLTGVRTAGKSDFTTAFSTDFYRDYKNYCSGDEAHSSSRFGDILTSSTFPRMIDDWEKVKDYSVNILKESATGISPFKRKRSDQTYVTNKPKVSSLCITSQDLGEKFNDPANLSRAIVLDYDKSIKRNLRWAELSVKIKKKKPFSLSYDYTKDWKNKDLDDLMKKVNETIDIDKIIKRIEKNSQGMLNVDKHYPRIREIYTIIVTGAYLFRKIFGIKLPLKNVFEILVQSRKNVTEEYLDEFLAFCNMAKNYEDDVYTSHKRFLTCVLIDDMKKGVFYYTSANKRDYQEYSHTKIGIRPLTERLREALTNKSLIQYKNVSIHGANRKWVMVIKHELIYGNFGS